MGLIASQGWDGVTAPALPTGWTYDSGFATTTGQALSAPNALTWAHPAEGTAYYGTPDGAGGNVVVKASFTTDSAGGSGGNDTQGSVFAHRASPSPASGATYYRVELDFDALTLTLYKFVSGTKTSLASLAGLTLIGGYGFASDTWFTITLTCDSTSISVSVVASEGGLLLPEYLQPDGSWGGIGPVNCFSLLDGGIAGAGLAGVVMNSGGGDIYSDDFEFDSIDTPVAPPPPVVINAAYVARD